MGKLLWNLHEKDFPPWIQMNGETVYIGNKLPTAPSGKSPSTLLSCECTVKWAFLKYMMNTNPFLICLHVFNWPLFIFLLDWRILFFLWIHLPHGFISVWMFIRLKIGLCLFIKHFVESIMLTQIEGFSSVAYKRYGLSLHLVAVHGKAPQPKITYTQPYCHFLNPTHVFTIMRYLIVSKYVC